MALWGTEDKPLCLELGKQLLKLRIAGAASDLQSMIKPATRSMTPFCRMLPSPRSISADIVIYCAVDNNLTLELWLHEMPQNPFKGRTAALWAIASTQASIEAGAFALKNHTAARVPPRPSRQYQTKITTGRFPRLRSENQPKVVAQLPVPWWRTRKRTGRRSRSASWHTWKESNAWKPKCSSDDRSSLAKSDSRNSPGFTRACSSSRAAPPWAAPPETDEQGPVEEEQTLSRARREEQTDEGPGRSL